MAFKIKNGRISFRARAGNMVRRGAAEGATAKKIIKTLDSRGRR